jgi:putative transposase
VNRSGFDAAFIVETSPAGTPSYDIALAEIIHGLYKTELIKPRKPWRTIDEVEYGTARWVDWFNHHRFYEYCGDISPVDLETAYHAQYQRPAAG